MQANILITQSALKKKMARVAATAFGGESIVNRYWDDHHGTHVDMLRCNDSPRPGVTAYGTIGVSEALLPNEAQGRKTELVGASNSETPQFADCLSIAAFFIINNGWFVAPGVVFPDVLSICGVSPTLKHFIFLRPFSWGDRLRSVHIDGGRINWLMAVPISDEERSLAEAKGVPALEALFKQAQVDLFDLSRRSVEVAVCDWSGARDSLGKRSVPDLADLRDVERA